MSFESEIEKLRRNHHLEHFDCGKEPLNRFILRYAFANQQANASQTYVACNNDRVIGYHTLVVGEIAHVVAPDRLVQGLARHPVPVMVLARLAVALDHQKRGIGPALLRDALLRTLRAADIAGIRAFAVHAKDEQARGFYAHFDFVPSPVAPLHRFLLLKDIKAQIR